ncbi:T9SS type A sorting domain-containing protein [Spirosoma sp. HMF4905]|uniref:T9SS type A sorting domain-containing protein n=1 Tax=Spirosoma arboris TaxID=2682092 RepID=A0A7K1S6V5_9BACT|nr:T9SS type A sorting domain-containing protein [Spirosoma arboris]MVM29557.1 T9SS type A sorting domain-containing protein [Spirosoma arboris]
MRLLLLFMGCCLALTSWAQTPQQHLRILISYEKAGQYLEQAVETIEAINTVGRSTTVEYKAGRSVVLSPGFEAKAGSTFTADIKPVSIGNEVSLQLKAYPNPFEQSTIIDYYLPTGGKVNLWVTDAQGKIVGELVNNENQSAGPHKIEWAPRSLNAGVYIPIVESNNQKAVSRLIKK